MFRSAESRRARRRGLHPLVTIERDRPGAPLLVVACTAGNDEHPHYGIFTRRQVESIRRLGIGCDLVSIAGYRSPRAYIAAAAKLTQLRLNGHRYALVHAHGGEAALAASTYRSAPLLVSYQGSDILGSPESDGHVRFRWRLRSTLVRHHSHVATAAIVKSQPMLAALPATVAHRTYVIPNGVDRERFRPRDRSAARAALGWDPGGRVVLFASDPSRSSKRPDLARMACEIASRQVGPIRFQVAHGLAPELMPEVINASDCLLHPSASEGSPNVVKEALACNLPVVATPVGDIPGLLGGVKNCYVCPPNAADLAAALVRCLDPPRRSDGREHSEQLDESHIAERVARLYEQLAGTPLRGF